MVSNEGWASSTREYDVLGNVLKQSFFGIDGKPTDPKVMVPEGLCRYDRWGNRILLIRKQVGVSRKANIILVENYYRKLILMRMRSL